MRWTPVYCVLCLVMLSRFAIAESGNQIAVLAPGLLRQAAKATNPTVVEESWLAALGQAAMPQLLGQSDLSAAIGLEKQKDLLGCDTTTCMAEIGAALNVPRIVELKIDRVDATWTIMAKLLFVGSGSPRVDARVIERVNGAEQDMLQGLTRVALQLAEQGKIAKTKPEPTASPASQPAIALPTPAASSTPVAAPVVRAAFRELIAMGIARVDPRGNAQAVSMPAGAFFTVNSAALSKDGEARSQQLCAAVAELTKSIDGLPVEIRIHSDNAGSSDANLKLTDTRAAELGKLVRGCNRWPGGQRHSGIGSNEPIAPNTSSEGRATNRRIEIIFGTR